MSYNNVNKLTGELIPVAGANLYAELPVGSWIKYDMDELPTGFLKEGDTISQSEYPELYAKYGSTVPYKADTSELSAYEDISFSNNQYTALYDGILELNIGANADTDQKIYVNGFQVVQAFVGGSASRETASINVKKGDVISYTTSYSGSPMIGKAAYYKKSLIVKAKRVGAPSDIITSVKDALCSYSTEETIVGTWVNGKPIYRKVLFNNDKTQYLLGSNNTINISMLNPNEAEEIIKFDVMIHSVSDAGFITGDSSWIEANCLWNRFRTDLGQTNISSMANNNSYYIRSIVLEYTKTAD
jgi:hypothetical protein